MAIKASDLRKSAEGDPAALQQSHAPDVRIGGNLVVGGDLAVPAGQTWRVNGNVKIEDGAAIRIGDGATLALTGIDAERAAGGGHQQRRITISDAVRYLEGDDGGQQQQIVLRAPAEPEPSELERLRSQIKQYTLEPEPTEAERQMVKRIKAEADRFAMGVSPAEAERLRAQIDHPFLLSPDEAKRAAAQFTSFMAPTALEGYAAELMRPPHMAGAMANVKLAMAENLWQTVEPVMLSAGSNLAEMLRRAAEPAMIGLAQQIQDTAAEQGRQMMAAINGMAWPGPHIAEQIAEQNKQMIAAINGMAWPQQTLIDAMSDLDLVRRAVRNSGFSLGALDDVNISLGRLYEQRQAPPARRPAPQPPAERVQVVSLGDEVLLAELDRRLRGNSLSSEAKQSMARLLQAYTGRGKPGPQEPPMETKIALVEEWERLKAKKGVSQTAYVAHHAAKIYAVGLRTFQEYCKEVRLWRKVNSDYQ